MRGVDNIHPGYMSVRPAHPLADSDGWGQSIMVMSTLLA